MSHLHHRPLLLLALVAFALTACGRQPASEPAPILRIAIHPDGSLTADGAPITLEALDPRLDALLARKGTVYYYREVGQAPPHPNAVKVIQAIASRKLPVSLSTKPDYSDAVGPDGIPHPR